jgi:NTE family protein
MPSALGLVLTGGGARGAYQAGALLAISEITGASSLPFPVLAGSSAGSINVSFLAARAHEFGQAARDLADMWTTLKASDVYRTGLVPLSQHAAEWMTDLGLGGLIGAGRGRALLDTAPLRAMLESRLDPDAITHHVATERVRGVAVTATDYQRGLAVTFFEGHPELAPWSRITRIGVRAKLTAAHVLASSAIPLFFPAVEVDGHWYADGSIRLSTPLSPAIRLGAERIIAIAVRQADLGEPKPETGTYPTTAATIGVLLNALFLEALESDLERTRRINHTLSLLPREVLENHVTPLRPIDVLVLRPSRDPSSLVVRTLDQIPAAVRYLFRGLGASEQGGWDLLSYLDFDGSYTTRLMMLGYEDTMARADEIRAFLTA